MTTVMQSMKRHSNRMRRINALFALVLGLTMAFYGQVAISSPGSTATGTAQEPIEAGVVSGITHTDHDSETVYVCPMHPDQVSDNPGSCSQCGMFLVAQSMHESDEDHSMHDHAAHTEAEKHSDAMPDHEKRRGLMPLAPKDRPPLFWETEASPQSARTGKDHSASGQHDHSNEKDMMPLSPEAAGASEQTMSEVSVRSMEEKTAMSHARKHLDPAYVCPMHPDEVSDKPGSCSICGMFLVVAEGEGEEKSDAQHDMPMGEVTSSESAAQSTNETAMAHARKHLDPTYVCPMHPQIVRDVPDSCPICGMDLVARERAAPAGEQHLEPTYVCPMHPQIVRDGPDSCPICGMDLVARERVAPAGDHPQVFLPAAVIQNMGVRTAKAERRSLVTELRTQGIVTADDDRIRNVHPRAGGWVETLYLLTEGDRIERKEVLVDFYSPWINQTQLDFITALEEYDMVSFDPSRKTELGAKLDAARNSLRLLSVSSMDVMRIENSRKVQSTIQLMAPSSGLVTELNVREGAYVEPYQSMFTIVDLSEVWVMVDIYEHQAPWVRKGHRVEISAPAIPGRVWSGMIEFIYPEVDPKTRTLRARIEVSNPDEALLLNMFVQVDLTASAKKHDVLTVPREAVIVTGKREVVVKARGQGHFQPVEVTTGTWGSNRAEILSGLNEGDEVVVSGQFLIDSESSLQASFLRMSE